MPVVRHLVDLIGSCEVLGLRQIALGGIGFTAQCMVEHGMPDDDVSEALTAWVADGGGAGALLRHLIADHAHLDHKEDAAVSLSFGDLGGVSRQKVIFGGGSSFRPNS